MQLRCRNAATYVQKKRAQRKKLRDASYDEIEMGIDICLVFFNTTYPWPVVVYSFCRRSILTFRRAKSYKSARHCKNSHFALCSGVASNILQSHKICRKQLFVQSSGIKGLAFHAITATLICTAQTGFYPASAAWTVVCCVLDSAGGFRKLPV